MPKSLDEVRHHRLVHQQGAAGRGRSSRSALLNLPNIEGIVALRTNTSTAHGYAIELGMGIGGLPTYIVALGTDLIPIDVGVRHQVDIWMTYHPDARGVARVSFFIDWLKTLFDPKRYPWFGDEFIHPRELIGREPPPDEQFRTPSLPTAVREAAPRCAKLIVRRPSSRPNTPPHRPQPPVRKAEITVVRGGGGPGKSRSRRSWGVTGVLRGHEYEIQDQEHHFA